MAILHDNLPRRVWRALPVGIPSACFLLAYPGLQVSYLLYTIACVLGALLNVQVLVESRALYGAWGLQAAALGVNAALWPIGSLLHLATEEDDDMTGPRYVWLGMVFLAMVAGVVVWMCQGGGLKREEVVRWTEREAAEARNRYPPQQPGAAAPPTVPSSDILNADLEAALEANHEAVRTDSLYQVRRFFLAFLPSVRVPSLTPTTCNSHHSAQRVHLRTWTTQMRPRSRYRCCVARTSRPEVAKKSSSRIREARRAPLDGILAPGHLGSCSCPLKS